MLFCSYYSSVILPIYFSLLLLFIIITTTNTTLIFIILFLLLLLSYLLLLLLLICQNNFYIILFPFYVIYYFVSTRLWLFLLESTYSAIRHKFGYLGLGTAPKEKLSHLFKLVSIQEQDLYLKTWLWSPLICAEKAPCRSIREYEKVYNFKFVYF